MTQELGYMEIVESFKGMNRPLDIRFKLNERITNSRQKKVAYPGSRALQPPFFEKD